MLRLLLIVPTLVSLTAVLMPLQMLAVRRHWRLRRTLPVFYHRALCRLIGVRVRVVGRPCRQGGTLIVANHASWLDIPVITAVAPVLFVAKNEVAQWPLFGLLARLQRTVFVDRSRRSQTARVNAEIAARLAEGDPVVLFAEGTSGDGGRVLPFRTSLLGALREGDTDAAMAVQPLSVAYVGLHGMPLGRHQRPRVAWYGKAALLPHLAQVLRCGAIDVVVSFGEPVACDDAADRKALARDLETRVRRMTVAALRPVALPAPAREPLGVPAGWLPQPAFG